MDKNTLKQAALAVNPTLVMDDEDLKERLLLRSVGLTIVELDKLRQLWFHFTGEITTYCPDLMLMSLDELVDKGFDLVDFEKAV